MSTMDNIIGPPPLALAPLAFIKERLGIDASATTHDVEIARLALALTGAFERVTDRVLVKRTGVTRVLSGCDDLMGCLLTLDDMTPAIAVTTLHIDTTAIDPVDVVFGSSQLIAANDYKLFNESDSSGWAPAMIRLRLAIAALAREKSENIQVVLDCGYTPDDGSQGFSVPAGEFAIPGAIAEALLEQIEIVWRRKGEMHMGSKSISTPGGGGTIAFWSTKLARSVKEALAPYAVPTAALNLGDGFGESGGGQA